MCNAHIIDKIKSSGRPVHAAAAKGDPDGAPSSVSFGERQDIPVSFSRVVDLTHRLTPDFPSFFGPAFETETVRTFEKDGFNLQRISYYEHVGTHFDAPIHYSEEGNTIDEVPVEELVCPLAVIDIRAKAIKDPDYRLSLDDIAAFEHEHGTIPKGACVAMFSGWESYIGTEKFRGEDSEGTLHFPGFHGDVAEFLIADRDVCGAVVDTMSLDYGCSTEFPFHYQWLPSGRYGIENVANLGALPPIGATLIGGAPKFQGCTGGPGRVIALV